IGCFTLQAQRDAWLALAGADLGATLDGQPRSGVRCYLAATGGFVAVQSLGSCASVPREGLGGLHGDGQPLVAGDRLQWRGTTPNPRQIPITQIPQLVSAAPLQVILGAQVGDFAAQSLFDAFNRDWQVDQRADRMGVRLLGPVLQCSRKTMISEGVTLGAIQVPADGQPIVLLNDRQTIGGYPRLGALTPLSVARLAQYLPGTRLRLAPVGLEQAQRRQRVLLDSWR